MAVLDHGFTGLIEGARARGLTDDQIKKLLKRTKPVYRVNVPCARRCEQCGQRNAFVPDRHNKREPFPQFVLCPRCKNTLKAAMSQITATRTGATT